MASRRRPVVRDPWTQPPKRDADLAAWMDYRRGVVPYGVTGMLYNVSAKCEPLFRRAAKALTTPSAPERDIDRHMIAPSSASQMIQHHGVRQFAKFAIVGLSSTIINFAVTNALYLGLHQPLVPALTVGFVLSVVNGFFWNRHWTFKEARGGSAGSQGIKFLIVNIVGYTLNTTIVVMIVAHHVGGQSAMNFPHLWRIAVSIMEGAGKKQFGPAIVNGALAAATCVVVFWNFFANRLWTFKH